MVDVQIDILKTALDWAKAEMVSSVFFAAFGIGFLIASYGFWQFGKTDTAKAYVIPLIVTGTLLVILGVGLVIANQIRLGQFPVSYTADAADFLAMEIARSEKTIAGYGNAIFKFIPAIIIICAGLLMVMKTPIWHASAVAVIAMMAVILLVDTNASVRMESYLADLQKAEQSAQK